MFIFFALGATGGILSEVMQGRPILESPHFTTGVIGLLLLAFQAMLPLFFKDDPGTRTTVRSGGMLFTASASCRLTVYEACANMSCNQKPTHFHLGHLSGQQASVHAPQSIATAVLKQNLTLPVRSMPTWARRLSRSSSCTRASGFSWQPVCEQHALRSGL